MYFPTIKQRNTAVISIRSPLTPRALPQSQPTTNLLPVLTAALFLTTGQSLALGKFCLSWGCRSCHDHRLCTNQRQAFGELSALTVAGDGRNPSQHGYWLLKSSRIWGFLVPCLFPLEEIPVQPLPLKATCSSLVCQRWLTDEFPLSTVFYFILFFHLKIGSCP